MLNRFLILLFATFPLFANAQTTEVGYVKQYNGKEAKSAISGVEIQVEKAQSTISDEDGFFKLVFPTLKAGNEVVISEIYKSGYIIFNKDVVNAWRISDNKTPFVIVMCLESQFRQLKKKYYGLIEKSYKEDYEREKKRLKDANLQVEDLESKLMVLESEHSRKLSNINSYVEIFSRIDLSEMSDIEEEALRLIEDNKINEGIKKYEELQLQGKVDEQLDKLQAANKILQAGKTIQKETLDDLLVLVDKIKTQIGLYDIGGTEYKEKKFGGIKQIIEIYQSLRNSFGKAFNKELGKWMLEYAEFVHEPAEYMRILEEAASLPSYDGLMALGRACEYRSVLDPSLDEEARRCYADAVKLKEDADSICTAEIRLEMLPDFSIEQSGTSIYYRIISEEDQTVAICSKNLMVHNAPQGHFVIPAQVKHNNVKYKVVAIDDEAFYHNSKLTGLTIPKTIASIGKNAFEGTRISKLICKSEVNTDNIPVMQAEKESNTTSDDNPNPTNDPRYEYLKRGVKIVQIVSDLEMKRDFDKNATSFPEYEELISIGIIAYQTIIKGKTAQQISKYNDSYLASALKWAILNELRIRYDWLRYFADDYTFLAEDSIYDYKNLQKAFVSVTMVQVQYEMYQGMKNKTIEFESPEIYKIGELIDEQIVALPDSLGKFLKAVIIDHMTPLDATIQFNVSRDRLFTNLRATFMYLRDLAYSRKMRDVYMSFEKDSNLKNDTLISLKPHISLVANLVADAGYLYHKQTDLPDITIDEYREICTIAASTLCKNIKQKQDSLSILYLFGAINWALEDHLSIRYKEFYKAGISEIERLTIEVEGIDNKRLNVQMYLMDYISNLAALFEDSSFVLEINYDLENRSNASAKQYDVLPSVLSLRDLVVKYIQNIADENDQRIMYDFIMNHKTIGEIDSCYNISYDSSLRIICHHLESINISKIKLDDLMIADYQNEYGRLYLGYGRADIGENYLSRAIQTYDVLYEKDHSLKNHFMEIRNNMVLAKLMLNKTNEALEFAQLNMNLEDNESNRLHYAQCYNYLAYQYVNDTDFNKAIQSIDKAIIIDPKYENLYDSKGEILLMQGKNDEALTMWKKVLELNPDFLKGYPDGTNLSNGLKKLGLIE